MAAWRSFTRLWIGWVLKRQIKALRKTDNLRKQLTYVSRQDRGRKFLGKPLGDVATVERIYQFTDDEIVGRAAMVREDVHQITAGARRRQPRSCRGDLSRRSPAMRDEDGSEAKTDDVRQKTGVAQDLKLPADLDSLAP